MNRIFYWIKRLSSLRNYTLGNFTVFVLVLFCIQYIPLESRAGVSMLKIGVSFLCLFFLLMRPPFMSKALMLLTAYFVVVFALVSLHPQTFRLSTMLYLLSFIIVYLYVYDSVVCREIIDYETFMKFIVGLIYAYTVVLMMQQALIIFGIRSFPLLNLTQFLDRGIGANSLSYEPSSAARIMAVLYLSLIRMLELKLNRAVTVSDLWQDYKWLTIGFLWTMLTMGSGTAMICLVLLSFYFLNLRHIIMVIALSITFIIGIQYIEFKPIQRVKVSVTAMLTGDKKDVMEADGSAASRIVPIMNFFALDFMDKDTWLGRGIDYTNNKGGYAARVNTAVIGGINEYGMISFLILLIFIYSCVIYKVLSLETLLFTILFGCTLVNIAYVWGAVMVFSLVRFFQTSITNGPYNQSGNNSCHLHV